MKRKDRDLVEDSSGLQLKGITRGTVDGITAIFFNLTRSASSEEEYPLIVSLIKELHVEGQWVCCSVKNFPYGYPNRLFGGRREPELAEFFEELCSKGEVTLYGIKYSIDLSNPPMQSL